MKNNYKQKLLKYQNNIISDYMLINMKAQKMDTFLQNYKIS